MLSPARFVGAPSRDDGARRQGAVDPDRARRASRRHRRTVRLASALALVRLLSGLLYGVGVFDVVSFAAALVAVLGASSIPAWRASRTDSIVALRHR
jgi:hypothetical protein